MTSTPVPPVPPLRGSRPDAETAEALHLIKRVTLLRATYQVRLLAFRAAEERKRLVLHVPPDCRFDPGLEQLASKQPGLIVRADLP